MVFYKVHQGVKAAMHRAAMVFRRTEVLSCRRLLIACNVHGVLHQLSNTLVSGRSDRHHGDAQQAFHLVNAHRAAVALHLVHHIKGKHHWHSQFHELHGEIQVTLYIGGIDKVYYAVGAFAILSEDELPADNLLTGVRRETVYAWQVCYLRVLISPYRTALAVNGHAGEVAHVLVGSRQLVEQRGLAAVLVSGKGKAQHRAIGQRVLMRRVMKASALAQSRVESRFT